LGAGNPSLSEKVRRMGRMGIGGLEGRFGNDEKQGVALLKMSTKG